MAATGRAGGTTGRVALALVWCVALAAAQSCQSCRDTLDIFLCRDWKIKSSAQVCSYWLPHADKLKVRTNTTYCGCGYFKECNHDAYMGLTHTHTHSHYKVPAGNDDPNNHQVDEANMFKVGTCKPHAGRIAGWAIAAIVFWMGCVSACCLRPKFIKRDKVAVADDEEELNDDE